MISVKLILSATSTLLEKEDLHLQNQPLRRVVRGPVPSTRSSILQEALPWWRPHRTRLRSAWPPNMKRKVYLNGLQGLKHIETKWKGRSKDQRKRKKHGERRRDAERILKIYGSMMVSVSPCSKNFRGSPGLYVVLHVVLHVCNFLGHHAKDVILAVNATCLQ